MKIKKCLGFRKPCDNEVHKKYKNAVWCEECDKRRIEHLDIQFVIIENELTSDLTDVCKC